MIRDVQDRILKLKKEKDVCILAHSYVAKEITEIADIVGDSFQLSRLACDAEQKNILFCGVHFMAETAKMLSPEKRVFLANKEAGCPMAEQLSPEELARLKAEEPERRVVAYINTTAALKELCDVCVTSSSAVEIVGKLDADKILFIPDCNLGDYVRKTVKNKDIKLIKGGCPIHASITEAELDEAKAKHPDALVLVHPECIPAVAAKADYIGSTSGIMSFAKKSQAKKFIIGTEISIAEALQYECPHKEFFPISKRLICPDMKLTTLMDVLYSLENLDGGAFEIKMTDGQIERARKCIDEMLRLG